MGSDDLHPDGLYVGLISGTSADGIDAALVSFSEGRAELLAHHLHPFPDDIKSRLISLFNPADHQVDLMGELDRELGKLFAEASLAVMDAGGVERQRVRAIGSHGQTIRHRPEQQNPFTLQIADPNWIAQTCGVDVVADFRRRDMVCGGQGAPLAPLFHQAFLGHRYESRVILNLGGIANITYLPATSLANASPMAMDTGPASGLMDAWCHRHQGTHFDANGQWARQGKVIEILLQSWLADPYFAKPAPKSTGKEYFNLPWAQSLSEGIMEEQRPEDVQATLLELSARTVMDAVAALPQRPDRVLVCGGGVHNTVLMERLQSQSPIPVQSTLAVGIDPDWVEAMCFAWLAKCFDEGIKLDTGPFTGATQPVLLGGLYKS